MDLKERLKRILERDFNITTDEQLLEAVAKIDLDLGIFTTERDVPCEIAS